MAFLHKNKNKLNETSFYQRLIESTYKHRFGISLVFVGLFTLFFYWILPTPNDKENFLGILPKDNKAISTFILALLSAPMIFYTWFIRAFERSKTLEREEASLWSQELNNLLNQAADTNLNIAQRAVAIRQLQDYLSGTKWAVNQAANSTAILQAFSSIISDIETSSSQDFTLKPIPISPKEKAEDPLIQAITIVTKNALKKQVKQRRLKIIDDNLSGFNLSYLNLTDLDFSNVKAEQIILNHTLLENAQLHDSNFNDSRFEHCNLTKANLNNSELENANLYKAILTGAKLNATQLKGADLRSANLSFTSLDKTNLEGALLQRATIKAATFKKVQLASANLHGANLAESIFNYQQLSNIALRGANLQYAKFNHATLNEADLRWCELQHCELNHAILEEADLQGAILINAKLQEANLQGANLCNANLKNADLNSATLTDTLLHGADLRGVKNLNPSQLQRAKLWQFAYRDQHLACGTSIPTKSK